MSKNKSILKSLSRKKWVCGHKSVTQFITGRVLNRFPSKPKIEISKKWTNISSQEISFLRNAHLFIYSNEFNKIQKQSKAKSSYEFQQEPKIKSQKLKINRRLTLCTSIARFFNQLIVRSLTTLSSFSEPSNLCTGQSLTKFSIVCGSPQSQSGEVVSERDTICASCTHSSRVQFGIGSNVTKWSSSSFCAVHFRCRIVYQFLIFHVRFAPSLFRFRF